MTIQAKIKTSAYYDSVTLMLAAKELLKYPGVEDAVVVMGTPANKDLLKRNNLYIPDLDSASANDLIIAIRATGKIDPLFEEAEKQLQKKAVKSDETVFSPKTLRGALNYQPASNLAVISVAGRFAASEAWQALHSGLHVMLFSDNVAIEDEIALKKYAVQHDLLLMGPGAGTALLNGVGLGFANAIPRGPAGIVSAAGTGLQEVSTLLAKKGVGTSQGIGTGGRDLKKEVGGIMMLAGIEALQSDPQTQVIVLISKPPDDAIAQKVYEQVQNNEKPTVICFLGSEQSKPLAPHLYFTQTLEEAAHQAAILCGKKLPQYSEWLALEKKEIIQQVIESRSGIKPSQKYIRALFSGGTLCYEAQAIWSASLNEPVLSNAPIKETNRLPDSNLSQGHTAIDLGEEEFTVSRPHPMLDNDLRIRRIMQEANDPETAIILLDIVLGYGAHPDPASELGAAVSKARQMAEKENRRLIVTASVTGTENDPQCLSRAVQMLKGHEIQVSESNAAAARMAAEIVSARNRK